MVLPSRPRAALLIALVASGASGASGACGAPARPAAWTEAPARTADGEVPADAQRRYTIWLGGARIGTAVEDEAWTPDGVVLRRTETLRFLRGASPVEVETTITITADRALVPVRVSWRERGATTRQVDVVRTDAGWRALDGSLRTELARVPEGAVPTELVPLLLRRDGRYEGAVFMPARGFVGGRGRVEPVAPGRLIARLELTAGPRVEATIDLAPDGAPARVVDGEGVIAMRATPAQAAAPFDPVDLIAATSVPLTGVRSRAITLAGDLALPALPGQDARPGEGGVDVELSATLPGALPPGIARRDRTPDITAVVASVRHRIAPDLGAGITSPRDVELATAGDCTTFALAYAALAARLDIPTRVVTGLRVDGARLVRHRWAVSWTGRAWVAVDAAFGAVPAGGDLIGLAIHDADDAGLIAGEAALTAVHAARWR